MGFKDFVGNLFKPVEDDYDDREYLPREDSDSRSGSGGYSSSGFSGSDYYRERETRERDTGSSDRGFSSAAPSGGYSPRQGGSQSSTVNGVSRHPVAVTTTLDVVRIEPRDFRRDSCTIVDSIRQGCAIVVNTEHTGEELARRILDFISGGAYALDAQPEKVGEKVYLITPKNVRLLDDPASVIESSEDRI